MNLPILAADDPRHGTVAGHCAELRLGQPTCGACRRAKMRYEKARLLGGPLTVPSIGTRRRIEALRAIGWPLAHIAREGGWAGAAALKYVYRSDTMTRTTALRVIEVYERLQQLEPPAEMARRAATWARRTGAIHPPSAWIDVDMDDPTTEPDPGWTDWSRRKKPMAATLEDFDWLVSQGESAEQAASRLGVELATIADYRRRAAEVEEVAA